MAVTIWALLAAFLTGTVASMGLGGGVVLILYFAIWSDLSQLESQGINLLFFIPIAILALTVHTKNKLVEWKKIIPAIFTGVLGAVLGAFLAKWLGADILVKIFAAFVILIGLREVFSVGDRTHS
jgi:uncharacterized membrane protein YfcA